MDMGKLYGNSGRIRQAIPHATLSSYLVVLRREAMPANVYMRLISR